jgi:hypothetical protein
MPKRLRLSIYQTLLIQWHFRKSMALPDILECVLSCSFVHCSFSVGTFNGCCYEPIDMATLLSSHVPSPFDNSAKSTKKIVERSSPPLSTTTTRNTHNRNNRHNPYYGNTAKAAKTRPRSLHGESPDDGCYLQFASP